MFRILFFLSLPALSLAAELSLSGIAARVRSHHPMLKAARMAVEEARGRQLGSGRLANPTLESSFQIESRVSPRALVFGVDQSFPLTKRLSLEKRLTGQLVTAAEFEVRDVERKFIAEAQSLAVQLLALKQQRDLRQQQTALATKLSEFVQGRAKAGELSPLDAAQAQVDAQRLLVEARKLENQTVSLLGALKPMLGLAAADSLTLAGAMPALTLPGSGTGWTARADYQLKHPATGVTIGVITSGALSPTLGYPVAMAYIRDGNFGVGDTIMVDVRGNLEPYKIVKLPFYKREH
jgi:cobalt-zinc-cadmium efflux system outer membrane protein